MGRGATFPLSIVLQTVDRATAGLRAVETRLAGVAKRAAKMSKRLGAAGRSLSTSVTLPVVALGGAAVKASADFEDGMSKVSTLVDTNVESMDNMGEKVKQIGLRTPVALDDLTAALYDTRSAGIDASSAMTVLEKSAQLGVAGLGSTNEAVDIVTSSINAFALKGEDAKNVYDQVFKTIKFGKTDLSKLAQGFGGVASTVADSGTKLDEYLAAVAALSTTGTPAAEIHTKLRAVINGLGRDTKETREVFKKLGAKDFKDLIKQSGGLVPALQKVNGAVGGNSAKMGKLIGSTRSLGAVLGLVGAQNDTFTKALASMRDGSVEVDKAFAKRTNTTTARAKKLKNRLTVLGITMGKFLVPIFEKMVAKLTALARWFSGLDDNTKKWIVRIAGAAAVLGPLLLILGKLIAVFGVVTKAIGLVAGALKILTLIFAANPVGAAIAVIAIGAITLMKAWGPVGAFFKGIWDGIVAVFKDAIGVIMKGIDGIITAAKAARDFAHSVTKSVDFGKIIEDRENAAAVKAGTAVEGSSEIMNALKAQLGGSSTVRVEFVNTPSGARVSSSSSGGGGIATEVGYQMGTP